MNGPRPAQQSANAQPALPCASDAHVWSLAAADGKRKVGQFTPFDLLVVMLASEAVSNAMTRGDESLVGGLLSRLRSSG